MEVQELDDNGARKAQSLKENIANILGKVNRAKDEYVWPVMSLLFFLRPLHYWAMRNKLKLEEGQKVLEVGSGYPLYKVYSDRVGREGIFVSLDIVPEIQRRSQKILYWWDRFFRKEDKYTESPVVSDATRMPFRNNSFDAVVGNNFTGGKKQFIQEAFRVLRPGGKLVTTATEVLGIPLASRQNYKLCNSSGFEGVKMNIGTPADILPPGFLWNWYVEAKKPELSTR